jgi:phosphatidylserine decarboxylase
MTIHKEGYSLVAIFFVILLAINLLACFLTNCNAWVIVPLAVASLGFWGFILWFFRNPNREVTPNEKAIYAPADGKVVVIEETTEGEYLHDKRLQVSIFMSPLNVHVNRFPISGNVAYYKYHPGDYLVAWHPKSSTHNERTTVVIEKANGVKVLMRQIAGAVARRIVCYAQPGQVAVQGKDMGFIKFGSRVDLFLPVGTKINVEINQKVLGNKTIIGYLD